MLTGNDIRRKFLDFFAAKGHAVVESSALVPHDDPTLLFTNAGMVQFKRVFMGEDQRGYVRAATSQRCVRAGGKHNDLENVGYTARHHTFFEMLGNFSFGDYFKKDAIDFAWDFLTRELGLPPERLWVSVFREDDEAYGLWEAIPDLPKGRIIRLGEKDNFWAMGDTGPCGPCSEILIDQGPEVGCQRPDCKAGCDCDRFLELWNLVFMQFYRSEDGALTPLPKPSIDTGMGLERISAVVQGVHSNYDSDLFQPIISRIGAVSGKKYGEDEKINTAMRVIADHSRAATFLIADGVLPSNEGRGYVLRRVMRRAIRYGRTLGLTQPFLSEVASEVVACFGDAYPHLVTAGNLIGKVLVNEEERFLETLDNGIELLQREIDRLRTAVDGGISGDFIFKLYDTYGFPVDIVRDIALEHGLSFDEAGYQQAMAAQREQSRQSWKAGSLAGMSEGGRKLAAEAGKTRFVGYETRRTTASISHLLTETGELVARASAGEQVFVVCPVTPFYAESGGQAGDTGEISGPTGQASVDDTVAFGDGISLHRARVNAGIIAVGDSVSLAVAEGRRQRIASNHTATHLLQAALVHILGDHVKQSGSLVEEGRLRFDFTHFSPLSGEELRRVEDWVNDEIRANADMCTEHLSKDEAKASGATALFGEKYGETVRVVSIGQVSKELCGGTHVGATGEIGLFRIVSEGGVAAGIRRVEAVTGAAALASCRRQEEILGRLSQALKSSPDVLEQKVQKLVERQKELEREISMLAARLSLVDLDGMIGRAGKVNGVRVVAAKMVLDSPKTLREVGDRVRDKMGSGIAVLGGEFDGKAALLALVSKDLVATYKAGEIVARVAAMVGGRGGGRADMAQAGGPDADRLDAAIAAVPEIVASIVSGK